MIWIILNSIIINRKNVVA